MAHKPEGGSGGGDGLCMIDPLVLGGVISDLGTMEAAINAETRGLKAEFEKVGVSVAPVNDLVNLAQWLHGELPMLRRRHAAVVLMETQGMPFSPGTRMLSVPSDPTLAAQRAGEFAARRIRDGLDGKPPGRQGMIDAAAALRKLTAAKRRLNADEVAFLQALYGELGRDVYRVPVNLSDKAAKSAVADGLLLLSNNKLGGGFDKLPAEIRQDLRDTGWRYWNSPNDKATDPLRGKGFPDLARFLLNSDPAGKVASGDEFASGFSRSTVDNLRLQQWLKSEYSEVDPPGEMARTALLSTAEIQQFLNLISRSHKASAELMSDPDAVRILLKHGWEDQGAGFAQLTAWAAKAALDPSSPEFLMAKRATADLINAVTVNGSEDGEPDHMMFMESVKWVRSNPEIAQAFSKLIAANIGDFGDDEPSPVAGPGDEFHLRISTDQRHRFAMLASTDQEARLILRIAAAAYKAGILADPTDAEARSVAGIDAMVIAAAHNAVYYDNVDKADVANQANAAARADDLLVKSIANQLFGEGIGMIPGGKVVGAGKYVLSRIVDEGIMEIPELPPVLPTTVDTDADADGYGVAEGHAGHDLATARLRADPGQAADLPPQLIERDHDGRPGLKDFDRMNSRQRDQLKAWAEQVGGAAYVDTYANKFLDYYAAAKRVDGGEEGIRNWVEAPTR